MRRWMAVLGAAIGLASAAWAAEPLRVDSRRVAEKPVVDGRLDDACWRGAEWRTGFRVLSAKAPASPQTHFAVAHDDDRLYVAVRCEEPHMDKLKVRAMERDTNVYDDDCIELFLLPAPKLNADPNYVEFHQFIANSAGTQFDATARGGTLEPWDAEWRVKSAKGEGEWTLEFSIPFSSLHITPETTGEWLFNITRERQADRRELSSWAPTADSFHNPKEFVPLAGLDVDFQPFSCDVSSVQLDAADGGFQARVAVDNQSGYAGRMRMEVFLVSPNEQPFLMHRYFDVKAGSGNHVEVGPFSLKDSGKYLFYVVLKKPDGRMVRRVRRPVAVVVAPLRVRITVPFYRQCIYHTERIEAIEGVAMVNMPSADRPQYRLRVCLKNEKGAVVGESAEAALKGLDTPVSVPAATLPVGRYALVVTLLKNGEAVALVDKAIRKLPKAPGNEVRVDSRLNLLVDGKPTLPFGFLASDYPHGMALPDINTLHSYTLTRFDMDYIRRELDNVHASGKRILVAPYHKLRCGFHGFGPKEKPRPYMTDEEKARMIDMVKALRAHPAILGWYLCDEPRGAQFHRQLEEVRDILWEADPWHPCIALDCSGVGCLTLARAADVLMVDPYPDFLDGGGCIRPLDLVSRSVDTIVNGLPRRMPVWVAPQSFNRSDYFKEKMKWRAPTFLEERCMTWLALVRNAKGILYYSMGVPDYADRESHGNAGVYSSPSLRIGMFEGILPEVRALSESLLAADSSRAIHVSSGDVLFLCKEAGGYVYLYAVNRSPENLACRFSLSDLADRSLRVISEARSLRTEGRGAFADTFEPHAVHLYTTDPLLGKDLKTLSDVSALIRKAGGNP